MHISRSIHLEATPDDVWHALTDPDALADWLEGAERRRDIVEVVDRSHIVWTWCDDPADGDTTSTVTVTLTETATGTRVTVVEQRAAAGACSMRDAAVDVWDRRLLGLELRFASRAALGCAPV